MKNLSCFTLLLVVLFGAVHAQPTQTIRGRVLDKEAKYPLVGVTVQLLTSAGQPQGDATDPEGTFRLANVVVGRQTVKLTLVGYKEVLLNNILVDAGKETILNLEMEEAVTNLETVTVRARRNGEAANEMATASARQFSVEETGRFAGSRGEPARMASNFAGVQGADDSRNDIVIRGNSPSGLLWRVEGITIPNPNHFAEAGTSGGPVSIINNKYLANSDFFTGAFPAEFGNTVSGVFDLKLRNGNNEKYETAAQFGFLGTELIAEGPFSKTGKASYLITGRYANLWLFKKLGIDIGTQATPSYADGFMRMNFPLKNKNGNSAGSVAVWALGGTSTINILASTQEAADRNIFGQNDRDQHYSTNMKVGGITYSRSVNKTLFVKSTLAVSNNVQDSRHEFLFLQKDETGAPKVVNQRYAIDSIRPLLDFRFSETKYSLSTTLNKKWGASRSLRAGINLDLIRFNAYDSVRIFNEAEAQGTPWRERWDADGAGFAVIQPFVQYKEYLSENLALTVGLTSLVNTINSNSKSWIEPRAGLAWDLPKRQKLSLATGLHSQSLPTYLYFYHPDLKGQPALPNPVREVGLRKSVHLVAGYSRLLRENMRFLAEVYYQYLYKVPVSVRPSSFSVLNAGAGAERVFPEQLENTGLGKNYGLEMTLEKFFSNNYYFLLTASLFDAKYQGSDKVWRNTDVNGRYAFNALFSREFIFKKGRTLNLGAKYTTTGGRWYGPVNAQASRREQSVIFEEATLNSRQFVPYNRFDIKTEYKVNKNRLTHTFAVDFVNILGIQNQLSMSYSPEPPYYRQEYQLGFLPIFFYRIDF
jgi:hypothetical protein